MNTSNTPYSILGFKEAGSTSYQLTGLTQNTTYSFQIKAMNGVGEFDCNSTSRSVTTPAQTNSSLVASLSPYSYFELDELTGPFAASTGTGDFISYGNVGSTAGGPILGTSGNALQFSAAVGCVASSYQLSNPTNFTIEFWMKSSVAAGVLMGFEQDPSLVPSPNYDRRIYFTSTGNLVFGVYSSGLNTITATGPFNDNNWHHVVGTLSSEGLKLYIDGTLRAQNAAYTTAQNYNGYWRVGNGSVGTWTSSNGSQYQGLIDEVAYYPRALTAAEILANFNQASN